MFQNALEFYASIGAALFPIPAGSKAPFGIVASFKHDFSRDPAVWQRWAAENPGCNFGIVAFASQLIIADIDTSGPDGRDEAWALWCALCAEWGVAPLAPHVQSARGGWHCYLQVPADIDAATLRQPDAVKKRINIRCVGYTVAAGSYYDGTAKGEQSGPYLLLSDAPPHPAPAALIQHCTSSVTASPGLVKVGTHDLAEVRALYQWMAERDGFAAYEDWLSAGMIARLEFGSDGLDLWRQTHDDTVTDAVETSKWNSFAADSKPGSQTLGTLLRRARQLGWRGHIRPSDAVMFADIPVTLPPPLAPPESLRERADAPRYLFETVADLRKLPANKWLVDKWIPEEGVGMIYGEYAHGKSFVGFDLLLHLSYGLSDWHGAKLPGECCDVLLIAREGGKGFQGRVDAFKAHHKIDDDTDRLVFMRSPANLGDAAQFEELKAAIAATGKQFKVVMVDTVGRALPGEDFFDPKSITGFMERLQQLGEVGRGVAIGVHHVNKSGDLFGSIYFGASSDFMFLVEREGNSKTDPLIRGRITCTKMKDGEDGWKRRVDYQKSETSLVVASITESTGILGGETKKLSADDQLALQALGQAIRAKGQLRQEIPGRSVTIDEWLDQCFTIGGVDPTAAKPKRDLHRRQVKLLANGSIKVLDHLVALVGPSTGQPITTISMPMPGAMPAFPIPPTERGRTGTAVPPY